MGRLLDAVEAKEKTEETKNVTVVNKMRKQRTESKQISAKIQAGIYEKFSEICRANGMSNNSGLNLAIAEFVRKNESILNG